jgi:hypothetical protein
VHYSAQFAEINIAQTYHIASAADNWRLENFLIAKRFSKPGFMPERGKHYYWPDNRASR